MNSKVNEQTRMYHAIKLAQEPIRAIPDPNDEEAEEMRKTKLNNFEARKNFDKDQEDYKFFEQVKHQKIHSILEADRIRRLSANYDGLNQSYTSVGDKNLLSAFKINLKTKTKEDYILPKREISEFKSDPESARRDISAAYAQPASKISVLSGFMVR